MPEPQRSVVSAVVLMDALGFRGILNRHHAATVVAAIRNVRAVVSSTKEFSDQGGGFHHFRHWPTPPRVHVGWFSDTFFIVAQPPDGFSGPDEPVDDQVRAHLVDIVAMSAGYCIRSAAQESMPMVFRGVVTVGDSIIVDDSSIYLGDAIDEAAAQYETANGAFVWLSPGASSLPVNKGRRQGSLVAYPVPLKDGQVTQTYVVNPFTHTMSGSDAGVPIRKGIEAAMSGDRSDIVTKRENTIRFLDHVVETEPGPLQRGARL